MMKKPMKSCLFIFLIFVLCLIASITIMFFMKLCPPVGPWPMPPWCSADSKPISIFGGTDTENSSSDSPISGSDNFNYFSANEISQLITGQVLLNSPNNASKAADLNSDGIAWFTLSQDVWSPGHVEQLHKAGIHLIGSSMTIRHLNINTPAPKPEMAALDIDGNPIPLSKPGMAGYLDGEYFYSIFNPAWQQILLDQGKAFIDMGAEGIAMDEPNTYGSLVFEFGGSFDEYSMAAFRDFLGEKYSTEELSSLFGIDDVSTFYFRDYLIEKGMDETWNKSLQQPPLITYEFFLCQNSGAEEFLRRFSREMKDYAAKTYGRQFVLGFNSSPQYHFSMFIPIDFLDYLAGEQFYFSNGYNRAVLSRKMLDDVFDAPIFYLTEVGLDIGEIPLHTKNLFKYMFADIYSNSKAGMIVPSEGFYTMKDGNYLSQEENIQMDLPEANRYYDFMKANPSLFGLSEPANVAVVVSVPSLVSYYLPSTDSLWGSSETFTVMEILLNNRISFETLTSGNGIWSDARLTVEDLNLYDVVLLPNVDVIADEEVRALLDYVENGGTVIQINNFANFDPSGTRVIRSELSNLRNVGTFSAGNGIWVNTGYLGDLNDYRWNKTENRQVLPNEQTFDFPDSVKIVNVVTMYHDPQIVSNAPITVTFRRYVDDRRVVLHLVNTDFDPTTDSFSKPGAFQVTLNTGGLNISSVKLYDFESLEVNEMDFVQEGDFITITVPDIFAYSIIEFQE